MRQRTLLLALLGLLALVLVGCGGGSPPTAMAGEGRAMLTVRWPEASRLIPFAANSIRVNVTQAGQGLGTTLLVRPTGGSSATATFDRLPTGDATVTATAYPNADGSGIAQATASVPVTILAGQTANARLTMDSTITSLTVAPAAPSVAVGATVTLGVTPRNAAGETVLVSLSTLQFTSAATGIATVEGFGVVTGVGPGTARVTVTETESGKTAGVDVTVTGGGGSGGGETAAAYDGIDYPAGQTLEGKTGGFGWSEPWRFSWLQNGATPSVVTETGLTYLNLKTSGRAYKNASFNPTGEIRSSTRIYSTPGDVLYYSFLMQPVNTTGGWLGSFYGALVGNGFAGGGEKHLWLLERDGGTGIVLSNRPVVAGQTYFLVVKITFANGADRVDLWVNPTPGQPLGAPDVTKSDLDVVSVSGIVSYANVPCIYDEFRLGPTWESVSPVQ